MTFSKDDYMKLFGNYSFLKQFRKNFAENPFDTQSRMRLGDISFGNPHAFSGISPDAIDFNLNEQLMGHSKRIVTETKANLEDIVSDVIRKSK